MKLSSAIPAVVAALGAEVALAVPVVQDDHIGTVAEAAGGALMDRNADTEEASSIALADDDGSLTDKVAASYPPILERKETSELIDHVLKRAGVVEAAAEITPTAAVPVPDAPTTKVSVSELSPTGEVTAAPELEARGKGKADCDGSPLLYQPDCGKFTETTSSTPPPPPPTSSVIVTKPTPLPTIPPLVIGGPSSTVEPSPDPNLLTPVYSDIGDNGPPPVDVSDDSYCWQGPEGQVHCVWTNIPKGKPKRTAAPVPGDMVARGADALPMPTTFATEVKRGDDKKTHGGPRLPKFT